MSKKHQQPLLAPGFVVRVWTDGDDAQAVDAWGIRCTTFDVRQGAFTGWDIVWPWSRLRRMVAATPGQAQERFVAEYLQSLEEPPDG